MPRKAKELQCSPDDRLTLEKWSRSRTMEARQVDRAHMILNALQGMSQQENASIMKVSAATIARWCKRFAEDGLQGLGDHQRSGRPAIYPAELRDQILALLGTEPPRGQATWDGKAVAKALGVSKHQVWRVLKKERICLQRQRSWCVSTDPCFAPKAADVVGLYVSPPQNAIVLSVDEKPSIQAIERPTGYVQTSSKKIVRGIKSTYKRHGTVNLFAALQVATGVVRTQITTRKRRVEFLAFMDSVVGEYSPDQEIHVILDNYCIHKKNEAWLAQHPNVHFHFTPTSASWLNMVEIWFSIFSRKALKGANFTSIEHLMAAIQDYIDAYNPSAEPFIWRKREVKGSQLHNTIANLCN